MSKVKKSEQGEAMNIKLLRVGTKTVIKVDKSNHALDEFREMIDVIRSSYSATQYPITLDAAAVMICSKGRSGNHLKSILQGKIELSLNEYVTARFLIDSIDSGNVPDVTDVALTH